MARSLEAALRAHVEGVLAGGKTDPEMRRPEPSAHPDPRMNLTLADLRLDGDDRFKASPMPLRQTGA